MTEVDALKVQLIETQLQLLQANAIILQGQRDALLAKAEVKEELGDE